VTTALADAIIVVSVSTTVTQSDSGDFQSANETTGYVQNGPPVRAPRGRYVIIHIRAA
jgi:hypothetical protein